MLEELNESEDTPDDLCMEKLSAAFFKGHPLEKPILGTRKSLHAMNAEDLHAYKDKFYVPGGTVISLAGNLTVSRRRAPCGKIFRGQVRGGEGEPQAASCRGSHEGNVRACQKGDRTGAYRVCFPSAHTILRTLLRHGCLPRCSARRCRHAFSRA